MSLVFFVTVKFEAFRIFIRRLLKYHKLKSNKIILMANVTCRFKPKSINIGKRFIVLQNSVLELNTTSTITIGNNCLISYGVIIALKGDFFMGDNVMVGEYTSIRDFSHDYTVTNIPMSASIEIVKPIIIGNDVWIGRGCIIMSGTIIEDGVVVGANSVVKGRLLKNRIYAGSPIKLIKLRNENNVKSNF